ncbi:MAG TPA: glycoside hydrolase family 9 protein, partial [Cytophagales bacterium]|nr:glycoside hydrolase family 9 protein [Cytophagales bacterium]
RTGEYGDNNFSDEFQWAALEMYMTTKVDSFYTLAGTLPATINIPGWQNVRALGYVTLANMRSVLTPIADTTKIKTAVLGLANGFRTLATTSAMRIPMNDGDFYWGSNGVAATQGVFLLNAFNITKDTTYLNAAISSLDYIMGRNATGYSFVTGYGTNAPMNIHHRISTADGVLEPIPGFLVGGPNTDAQTDCGVTAYPAGGKAKSYIDAKCSYSTNEIAINWNAPFAYLGLVTEAIKAGTEPQIPYDKDFAVVVSTKDELISATEAAIEIMPNPVVDQLHIKSLHSNSDKIEVSITDLTGKIVWEGRNMNATSQIDLSTMYPGTYILNLKSNRGYYYHKLIKQ